jgi:hypothetical protein
MTRWDQLGALYDRLASQQTGSMVVRANGGWGLLRSSGTTPFYKVTGPGGVNTTITQAEAETGEKANVIDRVLADNS